jgi:uncharacterized repeat protein (TIGR03803 family)
MMAIRRPKLSDDMLALYRERPGAGGWEKICMLLLFCAAIATAAPAQTFTSLTRFDRTDGARPVTPLIQGLDGNFYGTTSSGGSGYGSSTRVGTVAEITPEGRLTDLHSFCAKEFCPDGLTPYAGLLLATDGNFYGTTLFGGAHAQGTYCGFFQSCGTIFKIDAAGTYTKLYDFCSQPNCVDGGNPYAGLIQAADGNFYGTTSEGGVNDYCYLATGCGTVFKITPGGVLTTLYSFCAEGSANCTDGAVPTAGLVQGSDGNFYGTTEDGAGTIFKITPAGTLTTLYTFCSQFNGSVCTDGEQPEGGLIQGTNGNFYGTTAGGANSLGTAFEITPAGALTTLHTFCSQSSSTASCTDGGRPEAGLIQATDGNFYGTTEVGGAYGSYGTVFKITPAGALTTLYSFCSQNATSPPCPDGATPFGALIQATDGSLYGTTSAGGIGSIGNCNDGCGTVFRVSVGLGPFVETLPIAGEAGESITILGNNLARTTSVTFNTTAATFTVVSSTEITTTVPSGATTGPVQVVTPSGTLSSNVPFQVAP